jgi:putative transposase
MATLSHYFTQFEEEGVYHVYNRVVDRKPLFTKKRNYDYFLSKLKRYVSPYANIYAFCLLHNHFHILLRVKALGKELSNVKELTNLDQGIPTPPHYSYSADYQYIMPGYKKNQTHIIVSNAFKKMFQSYALAFNRQEDRIGTLFQTPFKRSEIDSDEYLAKIIYHIHSNPQKHSIAEDFRKYPYSSYKLYKRSQLGDFAHEDVLEFFGGKKKFIAFHQQEHALVESRYVIENE